MKGYVYSITSEDEIRYIGSTTNFLTRKNQHTSFFGNVIVEIIEQFEDTDRESLVKNEMFCASMSYVALGLLKEGLRLIKGEKNK